MIIIIHLMFWYTKKSGSSFVGTIGNTIYKEWGSSFATGYDVPNNSWDYADIALLQVL
jgi:hypothetical protein